MKVLFAHQNFPGQFKHLAPALVRRGDEVKGLTMNPSPAMPGIEVHRSTAPIGSGAQHPWAKDTETKLIRAEAGFRGALAMRDAGFVPDVIVGHPGWGDTLFLKDVWPDARLGLYCEFFYNATGLDVGFDPEFPQQDADAAYRCVTKLKTLPQRLHFPMTNGGLSPTRFQASTYPQPFRDRITVVHDGIDTDALVRKPGLRITLGSGQSLTADDEVITFVARNLEPYRGFHVFMRALPDLLKRRPNARVIVVGADGVSYGARPKEGTWRQIFTAEVADRVDWSRVHFVGQLDYPTFLTMLGVSRLHIYLTYPFVLSWSLMEAMALGAPILASDTPPLQEVIDHGENGWLFPFFDPVALVEGADRLLSDAALRARLTASARRRIVEGYDLRTICLPRQLAWVDALAAARPLPPLFED